MAEAQTRREALALSLLDEIRRALVTDGPLLAWRVQF
jgi:hypothetical protein